MHIKKRGALPVANAETLHPGAVSAADSCLTRLHGNVLLCDVKYLPA